MWSSSPSDGCDFYCDFLTNRTAGGGSPSESWIGRISIVPSPELQSDGLRDSWKNSTIAARSSRDRGTYDVESSPVDRQAIDEGSGPRSWPDRGPIVARSWPDRGRNHGYLEAKLKPNSHRFVAELKPRSMPTESPPRRHQTASTIASIAHVF